MYRGNERAVCVCVYKSACESVWVGRWNVSHQPVVSVNILNT